MTSPKKSRKRAAVSFKAAEQLRAAVAQHAPQSMDGEVQVDVIGAAAVLRVRRSDRCWAKVDEGAYGEREIDELISQGHVTLLERTRLGWHLRPSGRISSPLLHTR
jgi:hypothetical protein